MELILAYFKPMVEALTIGFLIYLPFLADRYLKQAQKNLTRRKR